jgi:hypothetical protein
MTLGVWLVPNLHLKFIWTSRTGTCLMIISSKSHQTSMVSESTTETRSLETHTMRKAPQSQSLKNLSFVTSVGTTRILLTSARPRSIWQFSTSNPRDTYLDGNFLKPTSIFIQMAPMKLVCKMFLLDVATPWPSRSQRTVWAQRIWWLSTHQPKCLETLTSHTISIVIILSIHVHPW